MVDGTIVFNTKIDTTGIKNAGSMLDSALSRLKAKFSEGFDLKLNTKNTEKEQKAIKKTSKEIDNYTKSQKKAASAQNDFSKGAKKVSSAAGGMASAFKFAAKAAVSLLSVRAMVNFGKEALEAASNLQEVQNVVDTAFGSMSSQVDAWAKTTVEAFGMSELSAKQFSSTYMAMGKGMGLDADKAANMAIGATERIGDIASFYNKSFEEVDTMMKSIWTGETESLKRIGVVMTETNLQAFALSKGIKTNISDMDQATKTQLRYAYVMEQTALAQGDFLKTQGSWANQTRILAENFNTLKASVGNALIQALTPALQLLNKILEKIIQVSKAFSTIASEMFGKQDTNQEAQTAAIEASTVAEEDYKQAVDETTEAQKRQLMGFDKLNKLQDEKTGKVSNNDLSGLNLGTDALKIKPEVDTDELDKSLERIKTKFDEIKNKAKEFLKPLKEQIDKLKSNFKETWDIIVGIWNDIKALGSPLKDWWDSKGVQDLQKVFNSILRIINVIWRVFNTVFRDLWDNLIYPFISDLVTIVLPMISDFVGRASELWAHYAEAAEEVFTTVWTEGIVPALQLIQHIFHSVFETLATVYYQYAEPIFTALNEAIETTKNILLNLWTKILKPIWDNLITTLTEFWDEYLQPLFQEISEFVAEAILFGTTFYNKVIGPVINAVIEKLAPKIINAFNKIKNTVMPIITAIIDVIKGIIRTLKGVLQFLTGVFTGDFSKVFEGLKNIIGGNLDQIAAILKGVLNLIAGTLENIINSILHGINWVTGKISDILTFDVPDWVPVVGGKGLHVKIQAIPDVKIPRLAAGGIVTDSILANIGERGREAVLPLENNTQWMDTFALKVAAAMVAAMGKNPTEITAGDIYLDKNKVGQAVFEIHNETVKRTGRTPLRGV